MMTRSENSVVIKKPFSIENHKWSDDHVSLYSITCSDGELELAIDNCGVNDYVTVNRDDAIAIAKHFNLL